MRCVRRQPLSARLEEEIETSGKCGVEVVGVPWNPVVAVKDVGVGVMPGPVNKLDGHDVVWYVDENRHQTDGKWLRVSRQIQLGDSVRCVVDECWI